jgi:hypothetical protein
MRGHLINGLGVCLVCAATLLAVETGAAFARIKCEGNFQVTKYGLIATPYCEEEQIAVVAQSYGWKVTPSEVHNNPLKKVYLCQILGGDVRLKGSCAGYSPESYGLH